MESRGDLLSRITRLRPGSSSSVTRPIVPGVSRYQLGCPANYSREPECSSPAARPIGSGNREGWASVVGSGLYTNVCGYFENRPPRLTQGRIGDKEPICSTDWAYLTRPSAIECMHTPGSLLPRYVHTSRIVNTSTSDPGRSSLDNRYRRVSPGSILSSYSRVLNWV
jgi:hypothetical protein